MRTLRRTAARLLRSLRTTHDDDALQQEIESHIALQSEDYVRGGMTPAEAARAARLKFGAVESVKERYRDERGLPFFDMLAQDLRYASRGMRHSAGLASVAVLSLGIGIGASTAIFSVVKGVLLSPLPYSEPDRLFAVREAVVNAGHMNMAANPLHIREWRKQCPSLENVASVRLRAFNLAARGEAEQIPGAQVDPELFDTLAVQPRLGRAFHPDETQAGKDTVILLSDALWRRRFHADPAVVNTTVDLGGVTFQIVGILPPEFRLPFSGGMEPYSNLQREPEIYQPLAIPAVELRPMGNFNYGAIARLRRGGSPEGALAEINTVQARFPRLAGENVTLEARLIPLQEVFVGAVRLQLWMLMGAVGAVLLIICVNLANLLIARMTARSRESAIRTALGATRARQVRQLLTESLLLSALGGCVGIALAIGGVGLLIQSAPADLPRLDQVRLDRGVLVFAVCVSMLTGALSGLLPASMLRKNPQDALKSGSHTVSAGVTALRTRHALIGIEVALSAALLIVAGLLTVSFVRLLHVDRGFLTERVLAVDLALMSTTYSKQNEREQFFDRLLGRLTTTPGVASAGLVTALPSRGETWIDPVAVEGDTRPAFELPMPNNRTVSPGYFETMGIRVLLGRSFEAVDRGRDVGILSKKVAERLWPGQDPLGKRFVSDGKPRTVVGVVADVRSTLSKDPAMIVYHPYWSRPPSSVSIVLRTSENPLTLAPAVRAAVRAEDVAVPIRSIKTLEDVVDTSMAQRSFQLVVVLLFGGAALLVASLGIYGVVSFSVASRRTELGVRLALGAAPADLFLLVIRQGMVPVVLGLAGGVAIASALGQVIRSVLFSVEPGDPLTISVVLILLAATALAACFVPARAAAAIDPVRAVRFE